MSDTQRYSRGAMLLHWLLALLLAGELALGFGLPHDASGFMLYQLHKSIGIVILLLTLVRIGWRLTHPRPAPIEGGWGGKLAGAVHLGFYFVMLAVPLTGWAIVSTSPIDVPTPIFGVVPWPHLPLPDGINGAVEEAHELLAFFGIGLFGLHVAGALRHHFLMKDGLLARMAPGGTAAIVLGLLVAVLGVHFGTAALLASGAGIDRAAGDDAPGNAASTPAGAASSAPDLAAPEASPTPQASETPASDAADEEQALADDLAGPPPAWAIQPGGALRFGVDNGGTTLNGSFARWSGRIAMDPDNPATAAISIEIDLASASLGDATQDSMLGGAAFFNTTANPTATWRATSVRSTGNGRYEADGTLSLKGASRPQRISFRLTGNGQQRAVSGSASVDRNAFGVGTSPEAADLAARVNVTFTFDAVQR